LLNLDNWRLLTIREELLGYHKYNSSSAAAAELFTGHTSTNSDKALSNEYKSLTKGYIMCVSEHNNKHNYVDHWQYQSYKPLKTQLSA